MKQHTQVVLKNANLNIRSRITKNLRQRGSVVVARIMDILLPPQCAWYLYRVQDHDDELRATECVLPCQYSLFVGNTSCAGGLTGNAGIDDSAVFLHPEWPLRSLSFWSRLWRLAFCQRCRTHIKHRAACRASTISSSFDWRV